MLIFFIKKEKKKKKKKLKKKRNVKMVVLTPMAHLQPSSNLPPYLHKSTHDIYRNELDPHSSLLYTHVSKNQLSLII